MNSRDWILIGVGIGLGSLILIEILMFWLWRRWKHTKRESKTSHDMRAEPFEEAKEPHTYSDRYASLVG